MSTGATSPSARAGKTALVQWPLSRRFFDRRRLGQGCLAGVSRAAGVA
ncbi:Uncharacterized protein ChrSV_5076 [Chromobacterium vaccinii]|nr:Uncharacterized protein ChrSW_5070 [Chromobacterium vaccinii]QND92531.1 Uncharacterized protein ChrSV_5076 [Chromobacterium vaccinii]